MCFTNFAHDYNTCDTLFGEMKNYLVTITFNTHCNENDITSMKKKVLECVRLKFWNTKNLNLEYKQKGKDDTTNNTI